MKAHTTITLDSDMLKMARSQNINISNIAEKAIQAIINQNPIENVTQEKNLLRKNEIIDQIFKLKAELDQIQQYLDAYDQNIRITEMRRLEKEKAELEASNKCSECGNIISEGQAHKFPIGLICSSCFRSGTGKAKKWFLEEKKQ